MLFVKLSFERIIKYLEQIAFVDLATCFLKNGVGLEEKFKVSVGYVNF